MALVSSFLSVSVFAVDKENVPAPRENAFQEACKSECPTAKSEHETHACMKTVAKKKKNDKSFSSSACFAALKEHEAHEAKEEGHGDHKH